MAERPRLRELAERVGIVASYRATGGERRVTSDATREALLVAMGFRAGGEAAAAGILAEMSDRARKRLLPPVGLVFEDEADAARVSVQLPTDSRGPLEWWLELRLEDGRKAQAEGRAIVRRGPHGRPSAAWRPSCCRSAGCCCTRDHPAGPGSSVPPGRCGGWPGGG